MENYNSPPPPYSETQSITNKGNSTTPSATLIPVPQSYGTLPVPNNGNSSNQPEPFMFQPHLPNTQNPYSSTYIIQVPPRPPLEESLAEEARGGGTKCFFNCITVIFFLLVFSSVLFWFYKFLTMP